MSFRALSWARLCDAVETTAEFAVLTILAEHANEADQAWPSRSLIAEGARMSVKTADRHIAKLIAKGVLSKIIRKVEGGLHLTSIYQLNIDPDFAKKHRTPKRLPPGGRDKLTPPPVVVQPQFDLEGGGSVKTGGGWGHSCDPTGSVIAVSPKSQSESQSENQGAATAAPARADAKPSLKKRFEQVEARCRDELGEHAPQDLVIGPVIAAIDAGLDLDRELLPAMLDVQRAARRPIRTWLLLVAKARERLTAPPIVVCPQQANGGSHGPHRKPSASDFARADVERLRRREAADREPEPLRITGR
jgi:hypothetical protein